MKKGMALSNRATPISATAARANQWYTGSLLTCVSLITSDFSPAMLLLDTASSGYGGSGRVFDWALARPLAKKAPILLAGGLLPTNVGHAVRAVRPYGVDVASGVESSPGIKDKKLMARFIRSAKEAL